MEVDRAALGEVREPLPLSSAPTDVNLEALKKILAAAPAKAAAAMRR